MVSKNVKLIFALAVVIIGILYQDKLQLFYRRITGTTFQVKNKLKGVFREDELSQYNGISKKKLYLSILGSVFDVTKGKHHYGKEGSYHYFVGKDGSRSFITGHFSDESESKDRVIDLSCDDIFGLLNWRDTFKQKYKHVGILVGRYYGEMGQPTEYSKQLDLRVQECEMEKERVHKEDQKYPPCNSEWSEEQGSKVWCSKNSGGISRSWVGVPRQLFTPGQKHPRCVCINPIKNHSTALLKEYEDCSPESSTCMIKN